MKFQVTEFSPQHGEGVTYRADCPNIYWFAIAIAVYRASGAKGVRAMALSMFGVADEPETQKKGTLGDPSYRLDIVYMLDDEDNIVGGVDLEDFRKSTAMSFDALVSSFTNAFIVTGSIPPRLSDDFHLDSSVAAEQGFTENIIENISELSQKLNRIGSPYAILVQGKDKVAFTANVTSRSHTILKLVKAIHGNDEVDILFRSAEFLGYCCAYHFCREIANKITKGITLKALEEGAIDKHDFLRISVLSKLLDETLDTMDDKMKHDKGNATEVMSSDGVEA